MALSSSISSASPRGAEVARVASAGVSPFPGVRLPFAAESDRAYEPREEESQEVARTG